MDAASVTAFDKQMAVNARGVMLCYKHAARQMISQGRGGRIIGTPRMSTTRRCANLLI
jgi:NAD(P)-dependent dehydrogenase (short-subunit alcohol dehydrogenase family)